MDAYLPHTKTHFSPKKGTRKALFRKALVSSLPPDFEKPGVFGPVEPSGGRGTAARLRRDPGKRVNDRLTEVWCKPFRFAYAGDSFRLSAGIALRQ